MKQFSKYTVFTLFQPFISLSNLFNPKLFLLKLLHELSFELGPIIFVGFRALGIRVPRNTEVDVSVYFHHTDVLVMRSQIKI